MKAFSSSKSRSFTTTVALSDFALAEASKCRPALARASLSRSRLILALQHALRFASAVVLGVLAQITLHHGRQPRGPTRQASRRSPYDRVPRLILAYPARVIGTRSDMRTPIQQKECYENKKGPREETNRPLF